MLEHALFGAAGGLLGLGVAGVGLPLLLSIGGVELPRLGEVRIGATVFVFTLLISLLAAAVAGLAPALRGGGDLERRLREAGRGGVGRRPARIRSWLVAAEMTFAAVVVAGAMLVVRSFVELGGVDPGYEPQGVVTARVSLPGGTYTEDAQVAAFTSRLLERVRALPGVESAGLVRKLPTTEVSWSSDFAIEGRGREEFGIEVVHRETTGGYFETLRVPLVAGRFFDARDDAGSVPVAIVNRTLADRYFPNGDAVGARIAFDRYPSADSNWFQIVGVVGDERQSSLASPVRPEIFRPIAQDAIASFFVTVRRRSPAEQVIPELRRALAEIDPGLPLLEPRTMAAVRAASLMRERFLLVLFGVFGTLALVLAALGVYGVTAHSAAGRRREIGVRMALGAGRRTVVRGFVRRGLVAVVAGLVAGVAGAVALGRAMSSLLYGVEPFDPVSLLAAPALLFGLALLASWLPAWRASGIAPAQVLRAE
jgi:predicted permease